MAVGSVSPQANKARSLFMLRHGWPSSLIAAIFDKSMDHDKEHTFRDQKVRSLVAVRCQRTPRLTHLYWVASRRQHPDKVVVASAVHCLFEGSFTKSQ